MKNIQRTLLVLGWLMLVGTTTTEVGAQAPSGAGAQAQVLFQEARADMDAGRFAQACPKLEESNRLDPGAGTQYRLAECYEKTGKLASAWSLYKDVESASRQAGKKDREQKARDNAAALEPRLPKLQVVLAPETARIDGLEIKRNGVPMGPPSWGTSIPVDLGAQRIVVTAPGKKVWERSVDALEGKTSTVTIDALEDAPVPAAPSATAPPASPAPSGSAVASPAETGSLSSGRLGAAIALGVTGLAGIGGGSALGLVAKSQWDDASRSCTLNAQGKPIRQSCDPGSEQVGSDAEALAHASTAAFAIGGASLAVAGVLLLLPRPVVAAARRAGWIIAPRVSKEHAGLFITGEF